MQHHFLPVDQLFLPPKETQLPRPQLIAPVEQLPPLRLIWLDEAASTHTLLKSDEYADAHPYTMVIARRQTAGRGQRGSSWESEDYKNLTFSMPAAPGWIAPALQFSVSEAVSMAVVALMQDYGIKAMVKWPNDIYVGDKKICGILIDHSLMGGEITRSILSAGINVNQLLFRSDAPNPVSMLQLMPAGTPEFDLEALAIRMQHYIYYYLESTRSASGRKALHALFMQRLYRNDGGYYPYFDNRTGEEIDARIADVAPDGTLTLTVRYSGNAEEENRSYAFKEVTFLPKIENF